MNAFPQNAGILRENPGQELYGIQNLRNQIQHDALLQNDMERNRRRGFTAFQIFSLIEMYMSKQYLSQVERERFAVRLGITPMQVKIWFENRRNKDKSYALLEPQSHLHKHGSIDWEFVSSRESYETVIGINCHYIGKESNLWSINVLIDLVPETGEAKTFEIEHCFHKDSLRLTLGKLARNWKFVPEEGITVTSNPMKMVVPNRSGHVSQLFLDSRSMGRITVSIQIQSSVGLQNIPLDFKYPGNIDSEIVLHIGANKLYVDKNALLTCSPVFRQMLSSEVENIHVPDLFNYSNVLTFLQILYGQQNLITMDNVSCLISFANKYEINFLLAECEDFLISTDLETPSQKLHHAELFGFSKLQEKVVENLTKVEIEELMENWPEKQELSYHALSTRRDEIDETSVHNVEDIQNAKTEERNDQ